MKDNNREPLLTKLAKQYLEEDGRRLLEEAEKLEENASSPLPAADGKVRSFRAARRRGRYMAAFGAVAAGLLLIFLLPRLDLLSPASETSSIVYSDEPAMVQETHTTQPPDADASVKKEAIPEDADGSGASDTLTIEEAAPQAPAAAPSTAALYEEAAEAELQQESSAAYASEDMEEAPASSTAIIPLSFTLPADFTVDSVRQDNGETIYHLANAKLDDVVLSVADAPLATDGLVEISAPSGDTAYGLAGADVQFLTFEQDGLRYRLTCLHDIQTLLSLWQHITSA